MVLLAAIFELHKQNLKNLRTIVVEFNLGLLEKLQTK